MEGESIEFDKVFDLPPEGRKAKAKELGALKRAREIAAAGELLRLIVRHLTEGAPHKSK
jgi:hypothetical protein